MTTRRRPSRNLLLHVVVSLYLATTAVDARNFDTRPTDRLVATVISTDGSSTTTFSQSKVGSPGAQDDTISNTRSHSYRADSNKHFALEKGRAERAAAPGSAQRRRGGPFGNFARAAENLGTSVRAGAEHVCAGVASGQAVARSILRGGVAAREHDPDFAQSPAFVRRGGASGSEGLAFGNFLKQQQQPASKEATPDSPELRALRLENDASVEAVMAVIDSEGWDHVTEKHGITVVKKFMPPPAVSSAAASAAAATEDRAEVVDAGAAAKFACVKAYGTLNADAAEVYKLFLDNERVHEYNDNCREVKDLEKLSPDTKVAWAASPRYGPFSPRDFVTIVHYRTLEDGTLVVVNRPIEHKDARRGKQYVRAEIMIATNIMRPNPSDPTKTDFVSVTHINPGGIVDSKVGAKIANALCAKAPVKLLTSLEKAANSAPVPKGEMKKIT